MDFAAISAGLAAFDNVIGTVKRSVDLMGTVRTLAGKEKVAEITSDLADATLQLAELKMRYSTLLDNYQAAKKELGDMKSFDEQASEYQLYQIAAGSVVYRRQPGQGGGEPLLWFCANCFVNRVKSVLQIHAPAVHADTWKCPACEAVIRVPNSRKELAESVPTRKNRPII